METVAQDKRSTRGLPSIAPYHLPAIERMPSTGVGWSIDATRAVLLIHDMQRYFLKPFGEGHDAMRTAIANMQSLRRACARHGIPIIYTVQLGGLTREERGLLFDFWGLGMSRGDDEEIIAELRPGASDTVLRKVRYSAYFETDLQDIMQRTGRDQLIVCGVYAHIGCLMTCVDAFMRDTEPFLVADAVADFSEEQHLAAIRWAASRCAKIVLTETLLVDLHQGARP